ncbi:MAG TPA: EpsI family protein [Vicinamibacterales bacterium]|jgi:EpsI family protein|nr:EpsI family protein [Vicinamibacterales bacterium]
MTRRLLVLVLCFLATMALARRGLEPEPVPTRRPLTELPERIGGWRAEAAPPFTNDVLQMLGVDEYVNRIYAEPSEGAVALYIGYYRSQRQGDTIHSPLNCLPGAGWQPISTARTEIPVAGHAPLTVNRFVIEKGLDRQVVLYWYQSHGRVIASEYWSKIFMVYDGVRLNRSDAAMVRVISPILPSADGERAAEARTRAFTQALFPTLDAYLPS